MRGIIGICVAALILILGLSYISAPVETARFANGLDAAFRALRPLLVLGLFAAWFPLGRLLHRLNRLSDDRHALWRKLWAPALIWYVVIEIGIGQGKPLWALILACLYGVARYLLPKIMTAEPTVKSTSVDVAPVEDKR